MHINDIIFNVCDVETTGFDPKEDRVVSVASAKTRFGVGVVDTFYSLVDPGRSIPPESSAVHHITDEMVVGKPSLDQVIQNVRGGHCFVAHNAEFDRQFLDTEGKPVICTMRLAKKLWPDLTHSNNQYLRYYFRIDPGEVGMAHNALADAVVTAHILMYELREVQRRRENNPEMGLLELQKWIDSPMLLGTCRFGNKHWGQPWKDVPKSYLRWMSENVKDMDRDTAFTVRHYLQ